MVTHIRPSVIYLRSKEVAADFLAVRRGEQRPRSTSTGSLTNKMDD